MYLLRASTLVLIALLLPFCYGALYRQVSHSPWGGPKMSPSLISTFEETAIEKSPALSKDTDRVGCILYVDEPFSLSEREELESQGISVLDCFVPPIEGKHPYGYHLALVNYDALGLIENDHRVVYATSAETQFHPHDAIADSVVGLRPTPLAAVTLDLDGSGIAVAIADSGLDVNHPDLPRPVEVFDLTDGPERLFWTSNVQNHITPHGTHVTGILCGSGEESAGRYRGVAPNCDLHFYKIGNDTDGSTTEFHIIQAINRAVETHCRIFSLSYGGWAVFMDGSSPLSQAVDWAHSKGMLCFVAAGNKRDTFHHDRVSLPSGSRYAPLQLTVWPHTTASDVQKPVTIQVTWQQPVEVSLGCSNLAENESLELVGEDVSSRGTTTKTYRLYTNIAESWVKTYDLQLDHSTPTGELADVHIYSMSNHAFFESPDPSCTLIDPAVADSAIAVGAYVHRNVWTDYTGASHEHLHRELGTVAGYSSEGPRIDGRAKPDLVAPGSFAISCRDFDVAISDYWLIDNDDIMLDGSGPADYFVMEGTSMATPYAAGVAALLLQSNPKLTPSQIASALEETALILDAPMSISGAGLIDVARAASLVTSSSELLEESPAGGGGGCSVVGASTEANPIASFIPLLALLIIVTFASRRGASHGSHKSSAVTIRNPRGYRVASSSPCGQPRTSFRRNVRPR